MFTLNINEIKLSVYLGVYAEEQEAPQIVRVYITLKSQQLLNACHSDELSDTVCYATLAEHLQTICDQKCYQLIEHLAYQLYQAVQHHVGNGFQVRVKVRKQAPIEHIDYCEVEIGA